MSIQGPIGQPQGSWNISHNANGNTSGLSKEVAALLTQTMGFTGAKVVNVTKGAGPLSAGMEMQLDAQTQSLVQAEVAQVLGLEQPAESVLIMIGGLNMVSEEMEKLKKHLKKIDEEKVKNLANLLGITTDSDVIIFAGDGSDIRPGGFFIISSGLKYIEESITD